MTVNMATWEDKMRRFFGTIQSYKGFGRPKVFHALVVIFAEFAVWGLLTNLTISAVQKTFPGQTLMMNGLILGVKGTLSFIMSPPIGYLSDIYGRKPFLLITVVFTCLPVPVMFINLKLFFIMLALSGIFSVTFSVAFAYVADITTGQKLTKSYGQVAATFAASLIVTPALGTHLSSIYGDNLVILLATLIALLDILFILFFVPESNEKLRPTQVSLWERTDFTSTIRKIGKDFVIWTTCFSVFLSYLPEAGQASCIFVYLKLFARFEYKDIAIFIASIGILSVLAQTLLLTHLIDKYGGKKTILIGLFLQGIQLLLLGFFRNFFMMWICGIIASISSITYPAISAYITTYADSSKQGLVQGLISAVRSLCGGIGPAMFGILFYRYGINVYDDKQSSSVKPDELMSDSWIIKLGVIGPPFLFGSFFVGFAILVIASFMPDSILPHRRHSFKSQEQTPHYQYTSVTLNGTIENRTNSSPGDYTSDHFELLEELED